MAASRLRHWLRWRPRRRASREQWIFYYEFLGLGGVETVLLNRLSALRSAGCNAQFWFSRLWCDGASYLSSADGVRQVAIEEVGRECAASAGAAIVVIDNAPVLRDVLDHCPHAAVFAETHVSEGADLERFYAALHDPRIAGCIVPSEYNAELVLGRSGFTDRGRIHVVPNGLHLAMWTAGADAGHAAPSGPLVLWIGRLEDAKDPVTALRCAAACVERVPGMRFLLIGNAHSYSETVADVLARSGAPRTNVEFVPHVPYHRMPAIYAAAAASGGALLSTSLSESSPMIVLEAMASGCPVVSTAVGGVKTLVAHHDTGWLFEAGHVEQAVDALTTLHRDETLRRTMVARAREYVAANHSADASAAALRSLMRT